MERSCGPRISLFILGTRHSPFVPIVPVGTPGLQGTLSDPLVSTERPSSEFSALSVRALPFLRALRALRGSLFYPCNPCVPQSGTRAKKQYVCVRLRGPARHASKARRAGLRLTKFAIRNPQSEIRNYLPFPAFSLSRCSPSSVF